MKLGALQVGFPDTGLGDRAAVSISSKVGPSHAMVSDQPRKIGFRGDRIAGSTVATEAAMTGKLGRIYADQAKVDALHATTTNDRIAVDG